MSVSQILIIALLLSLGTSKPLKQDKPACGYQNCPRGKPGMLNVHLICHTHDDVGWLKTVDQYYYGANNTIQRAGVQYILDSVIQELRHDPKKKFIYVETAFFWRWWQQQHDQVRHQVQKLVRDGQLEFIGGGWSMNDEATCHYNDIIDQMTWGFRRLSDTFGSCGIHLIGWQIDPFGHSREQASLFAQMYFDGLFLGRIDYQDKSKRQETQSMEMVWKGSDDLGPAADLFTGVLPNRYSPPAGFCFDSLCDNVPIMDDPRLHDYNVNERVDSFIKIAQEQAKLYATNHIVMTMGEDFNYQNANLWYKNLDKIIKYVNEKQINGSKVNVFYSTPSCYLYALNQANKTWPTKSDDFFPYASDPHAYWTGYFTSRPSIKGFVKYSNNFLQVCKQLETLARLGPMDAGDVTVLREAQGVAQHHDAVTGTEKQHVANDYSQRLANGIRECEVVVSDAYKKLLPLEKAEPPKHFFCHYLNISQCNITEGEKPVAVTIYNPLARPVNPYIRLPVTGSAYKVVGPKGEALAAQLVPIPPAVQKIPGRVSKATLELVFNVKLPALGFSTYFIRKSNNLRIIKEQQSQVYEARGDVTVGNKDVTVVIDGKTRLLREMHLSNGIKLPVKQFFYWYQGMSGNNSEAQFRASGAYIFRPNGTTPYPIDGNVTVTVVTGPLVKEIHQTFSPWISQVIRIYNETKYAELEWLVGPIPVKNNIGKEIITKFDTNLQSKKKFYTDANGRQVLKRVRNERPTWSLNITEPVSGNYYPVNSRIYIKDDSRNIQLTILTDRSQGGSSLSDGSIELMIHRRLLYDDAFGVGEPLNETGVDGRGLVVRGRHLILLSSTSVAGKLQRELSEKLLLQPWLSFAPFSGSEYEWAKQFLIEYSGLKRPLPPNIHLLTLEQWKGRSVLLRLEHFFEKADDPSSLSKPVNVSLKDMFTLFDVVNVTETTLGANKPLQNASRFTWHTENSTRMNVNTGRQRDVPVGPEFNITLNPMEIRTFLVTLNDSVKQLKSIS
ncbi:LOW QUALITY PROTEIN: lysosomal alpha-mannosidase-like [Tachypleus tridentatus]|uniref:LOW QUALITY PROTEIN: lysosomal alpha-mannosidase-like n=1 Tax=Tachypleus tridentatus TaxID=6853 RepID=UPI003FD2F428